MINKGYIYLYLQISSPLEKNYNEGVNGMMNENINNDEIFEEGFKDIINKIKNRKNKNTLVKPEEITDVEAYKIARDMRIKIENDVQYPGTIKVVVIRELRVNEVAK